MRTLLLAESHAATRRHLQEELAQAGYDVRLATDAGEVVEHCAVAGPGILVLSADFATKEGTRLLERIATHTLRPRLPLVVIDKAHLGKALGRQAILGLKPNAYVEDPLKPHLLREKLEGLQEAASASPAQGSAATLDRPPAEGGVLRKEDLPAQLCRGFRQRRSGILVLAHREAVSYLFFVEGAAVAAATSEEASSWPRFLAGREPTLATAVEGSGLVFPAPATVAEGGPLQTLWREYVAERFSDAVGQRVGRFAFFAGDEFRQEIPQAEVPALAPVLQGARRAFSTQRFGRVLKPHLDDYPLRTPTFGEDLRALGLATADLTVAMQVSGQVKLRELLVYGRGGLARSYSLFWFLHLCGALRFSQQPVSEQGEAQSVELPRRRRKPLPPELATQLREDALRILTGSYFKVLGLDIAADAEDVERAYREVATRFHPDTHAEYDIAAIQDVLESVQDKLTAAYRVLSSDERRQAYLQYLFSRSAPGRVSPVHVEAEVMVRRGEAHVRRGDLRSALRAFSRAVELNPKEPEYASYLAWFTFRSDEGTPEERLRAADKVLKRALALNPQAERPQIIRAIIDAESGDGTSARKRLRQVLEANPEARLAKAALLRVSR